MKKKKLRGNTQTKKRNRRKSRERAKKKLNENKQKTVDARPSYRRSSKMPNELADFMAIQSLISFSSHPVPPSPVNVPLHSLRNFVPFILCTTRDEGELEPMKKKTPAHQFQAIPKSIAQYQR